MLETGRLYEVTVEVLDKSGNKIYLSDVSAPWAWGVDWVPLVEQLPNEQPSKHRPLPDPVQAA